MATPILRRIKRELADRSLTMGDLANHLGVPELTMDMFDPDKDRESLKRVADFLGLRLSELIRESGNMRAFAEVYLDEVFPRYRDSLNMSRDAAWTSIESTIQYRGTWSDLEGDIDLILRGLLPPHRVPVQPSNVSCFLGECLHGCVTRCLKTGRPLGA